LTCEKNYNPRIKPDEQRCYNDSYVVGIVLKSNRKLVRRGKMNTPSKHIYDR